MNEVKRLLIPFELKNENANGDVGLFEGHGSIFGNIDLGGDIVRAGAFTKTLNEWQAKGQLPTMLYYHDHDKIIGDWLEMREDEKGLYVKGQLWIKGDLRIEDAVRSYNVMRGTGPRGLSIGYRVKQFEMTEFDGGTVRELIEVELIEISIAPWAMNQQAMVTGVKALQDEEGQILTKREVEKVLREAFKLSRRQAKAFIGGGYDVLVRDEQDRVNTEDRDDSLELSEVLASLKQLTLKMEGK